MVARHRVPRRFGLAAGVAAIAIAGTSPTPSLAATRPAAPRAYLSTLTPQQIQSLSQNATNKVIVLLRNQHPEAAASNSNRRRVLASDQSGIVHELSQLHAKSLHSYSFVNAVSATVSSAEMTRLQQDPAVQAVVPDVQVAAAPSAPQITASPSAVTKAGTTNSAKAVTYTEGSGTVADECPSNPANPILEPEALQSMNVDFGNGALAAHSLADGTGVKVAVFPDGLDPNIPDFKRGGGTGPSAIFDYQDFSGEGINGQTGAAEAFGDASSIISQGNQVFDLSGEVNPAHPLPTGCNIKIEGVAPGASLAVMKVFGNSNFAFNSEILQGIEYAINVDQVDILSQSFGGNPVPNPGSDPIAVADQDAVNAGLTVVVSSGDAGGTNTIGTPAVDSGVISAGATTDYRLYRQTTSYGIQEGPSGDTAGWLSDQISGLSSSGVTEANRTIDVLAPGEAGWSDCSTNTTTFTECADPYHGSSPQPIEAFGGTSESCPLTAGTAALVIQAYRDTHSGATPSPALVKQILMSTSRDVNTRAADQGAGLLDAYRAVTAARSYGLASKTGNALLYSPNAINSIAAPNTSTTTTVKVNNDGGGAQTVTPVVRALGSPTPVASGTLTLNQSTDPTFTYQNGSQVGDLHSVSFTVPPGTDRLHTAIAWNQPSTEDGQTIRFDLFDPAGNLALQSRPQGPVFASAGGFSEDEVHDAQAGTWTLVVFATNFITASHYTGPLAYAITSQSFHNVPGSVSPASATIASGSSASFQVTTTTPAAAGDNSESLVFGPSSGGLFARGTVPITLRSLATVGGSIFGTITGGNARMSFYGQELPYQFTVSGTHSDVDATIHVGAAGYQVFAFLVDPSGTPVDVQSSNNWSGDGAQGQNITLFRQNPTPGRWSLMVVQVNNVDSVLTSVPFVARLSYDLVHASAAGLPNSTSVTIKHGTTRNATITVTNTGNQEEAYMIDARRSQQSLIGLTSIGGDPSSEPLPISNGSTIPQFLLPPFSPRALISASSTVPITLDTSPNFGTPDVEGVSTDDVSQANLHAAELPASVYSCAPSEQGPFSSTATSTTFSCSGIGLTNTFAADVSTSAGNLWSDIEQFGGFVTYNPLVLEPGQSDTISVAISPTDRIGTHVSGFLALETFNFNSLSSDEPVSFPYSYTVG